MTTQTSISSETLTAFRVEIADKYRLERELGRGGMATVYLARDLANDRYVAVKVLLPELAATLGAERFLREIDVGKTLQHPNIVGVLDSGAADGKLFYTMPFVEGASLRDRLDREKQLGIEETLSLAHQVAEALDYAHSKGIIHRDIKPENILLHDGKALVADFGIARAVTVAGGMTLTKTGMAIGTPTYMSPEQAMGSKDVTPESDIYSLACVIYELLAGQPPFTGTTALQLLARHSLDNVPSLKIVRGTVPDAVEDAIVRAMAKVPADRFKKASDFANALTDTAGAAMRRAHSLKNVAISASTMAEIPVAKPKGKRNLIIAGVAIPLLAVAAWFGWSKSKGGGAADAAAAVGEANHIAVLYLDDNSQDHSLGYLANGLTEALIQELGTVRALKVTSRNGVMPFRGRSVATDSIGRVLNVGTVVSGTVAQIGDKLRVTVDLIDAKTGNNLSTIKIEKTKQDAFAVQDELAQQVSTELRKKIGEQVEVLTSKASTRNAAAWEAFQRAKQTIAQADSLLAAGDVAGTSSMLARADAELGAVAKSDDKWAAPLALQGLLGYRLARLDLGSGGLPAAQARIDSGLARSERAIALVPNDADALEARGTLHYLQWLLNLAPKDPNALVKSAEQDLDASVAANPAQASALNTLSHLLNSTSRITEGKTAALKAYEADPYLTDVNKTVFRLFQSSLDLNSESESRRWCDVGAERFPADYRFQECRLWLLTLETAKKPSADSIWAANDKFLAADKTDKPEFAKRKGAMIAAIALIRAGLPDSARAVASRSQANEALDPGGDLLSLEAIVRAQLGEKDKAIALLARYLAAHPQQRAYVKGDESWWFNSLKDEPKYKALAGGS
jgi:eukaryotic-like serine/threonine-protein kinase